MGIPRCFQAILRGLTVCGWLGWHGVMAAGVPTAEDYGLADQSVDVWETAQGLPQNSVTAIAQTNDGYLWLGTEGGLACFDDSRFQTFGPFGDAEFSSNRITALCADRAGGLWIGTAEGGVSYLFRGKFQSFTTRNGLADNHVRSIGLGADRSIWIGTARGLNIWRNGTLERPVADNEQAAGEVMSICAPGDAPVKYRVDAVGKNNEAVTLASNAYRLDKDSRLIILAIPNANAQGRAPVSLRILTDPVNMKNANSATKVSGNSGLR